VSGGATWGEAAASQMTNMWGATAAQGGLDVSVNAGMPSSSISSIGTDGVKIPVHQAVTDKTLALSGSQKALEAGTQTVVKEGAKKSFIDYITEPEVLAEGVKGVAEGLLRPDPIDEYELHKQKMNSNIVPKMDTPVGRFNMHTSNIKLPQWNVNKIMPNPVKPSYA